MKKWLHGIIVCLLGVTVLGGCQQPLPKITKEQQNNIVTRIARSYEIHSVEFTNFTRDNKTGFYYLFFTINDDDRKATGLSISDLTILDKEYGTIGLDPIALYQEDKRSQNLDDTEPVDLSHIKIKYLGE